ncbi:MAG: protein kinase [Sandaracinaceae bacterium]|nr:protein kinase [Sandaracinaceae bacterium]
MGTVWEAIHNDLGKRVAIKTLHPEVATNVEVVARFVREGRAAATLRHPNAADVSDVGVADGVPYLVMDFLEGESLAARLESTGQCDPKDVANFLVPILCALQAAHDEGIVHRDIKPENVFLARQRDGNVSPTLLDFGISKLVGDEAKLTRTAALLGTPYYMSPEQARESKLVDFRTDLYSVGVVMYEALAGRRPFESETLYGLIHAICEGDCPDIAELRPGLPLEFADIVRCAMKLHAADRYDSAKKMAADLFPYAGTRVRAAHATELGFGLATVAVDRSFILENPSRAAQSTATIDDTARVARVTADLPRTPGARRGIAAVLFAVAVAIGAWAAIANWKGSVDTSTVTPEAARTPEAREPAATSVAEPRLRTTVEASPPPARIPVSVVDAGVDAGADAGVDAGPGVSALPTPSTSAREPRVLGSSRQHTRRTSRAISTRPVAPTPRASDTSEFNIQ